MLPYERLYTALLFVFNLMRMCCDDGFNELISQLFGKGNKINLSVNW
jgi:hypothetical protein